MPFGIFKDNNPFSSIGTGFTNGLDSAVANVGTDPSARNLSTLVRDVGIESLPGNQRVSIDNPYGGRESVIKKLDSLSKGDIALTASQTNTAKQAGRVRETIAEKGLGAGLRKAGTVLAQRLPATASKIAAGSAASGGILAPALAIWGAGDVADTAVQAITGRGILDHAQAPLPVRGRWGAKKANGGFD